MVVCGHTAPVLALNTSSEGRRYKACGARRIGHARPATSCLTTIDLHHYRFLSYFARLLDACKGVRPVAKYFVGLSLKHWYRNNWWCSRSSLFVLLFDKRRRNLTNRGSISWTSEKYLSIVSQAPRHAEWALKWNRTIQLNRSFQAFKWSVKMSQLVGLLYQCGPAGC